MVLPLPTPFSLLSIIGTTRRVSRWGYHLNAMPLRSSLDFPEIWRSPFWREMRGILDRLPCLSKVLFVNASWSLQDQHAGRLGASIGKRMRHPAWDVDHFARSALHALIAHLEGIAALQNDECLILQVLNVRWNSGVGSIGGLGECEGSVGVAGQQLEGA